MLGKFRKNKKTSETELVEHVAHPGFLSWLNAHLNQQRRPEEAFATAMADNDISREFWPAVKNDLQERYGLPETGEIPVGSNKIIRIGADTIDLVTPTTKGEPYVEVIGQPFRVLRRVEIEDRQLVVYETDVGTRAGTVPEIERALRDIGQVLDKRAAADVISKLALVSPNHTKGQATYEVLDEDGHMRVPSEIWPLDDYQKRLNDKLQPHLDRTLDEGEWAAWARVFEHWKPYEWMPAAGLAVITPFSGILRRNKVIVPYVYHLSTKPSTGKTTLANTVSDNMWTIQMESAKSLESGFRMPKFMDAISLPKTIDEAQNFDWEAWGGDLKMAAETDIVTSKGRPNQDMTSYRARASFIFTSNFLPPLPEPLLKRMLIVHFDESRRVDGKQMMSLERDLDELAVCGPHVVRVGVQDVDADTDTLVTRIKEDYAQRLWELWDGWLDGARPKVWAAIYWGTQVLSKASGGAIAPMSIEDFCEHVVKPVEKATRASALDALNSFQSWLVRRISSATMPDGTWRGLNNLVREETWDDRRPPLTGWAVTQPLLDEYNEDRARALESRIKDLRQLAHLVAGRYEIPVTQLRGEGKGSRVYNFEGKARRAVFVPDPDREDHEPASATLGKTPPGPNGDAPDMAERRIIIVRAVTANQADERGAPVDAVLAAAKAIGVPDDVAKGDLDALVERGVLYEPVSGHVKRF